MASLQQALAGAQFTPPAAGQTARSVLLAGAAGRLGERILARLLGDMAYQTIHVLADIPLASTERKLRAVALPDWNFPVHDLVAVVSEPDAGAGTPGAGLARHGTRTGVYSPLHAGQLPDLARRARQLGVRRLMLVTPVDVLGQPSALHARIATLAEVELHQLGFESLILVRPGDHALRRQRRGLPSKVLGLLLDTVTGLMVGLRHAPLSVDDIARSAVDALAEEGEGLRILESDSLQERLRVLRAAAGN